MISTVLLLASVPQLITYETKAARLPVILAELSTRTGTKLECEPSFKNDVLVIRVDGVASKTLLDKIAQAAVGKWSRREETLVLSPDVDRRKEQESELLARRERDIQRMLDQFKKDLEMPYEAEKLHPLKAAIDERQKTLTQQESAQRTSRLRSLSPLDRLTMRSLVEIGAKRIAEIPPGHRYVFSANPTSRQFAWPGQRDLLPTFYAEWNLYQGLFASNEQVGQWTHLRNWGTIPMHLQSVDRFWLSVSDPIRETRAASVSYVNSAETVAFGNSLDVTLPTLPTPDTTPDDVPDTPIKLDPLSEMYAETHRSINSITRPRVTLDPELIEFISKPTKNEPLVIGSELYHQYAQARKVNLVAWLNDNSFGRGVIFKAPTVEAFDRLSRPNMNFDERDGWLVLTPSSPVEARRSRDDREVMESLIQSVLTNKWISFEAKADYVFKRPIRMPEGLGLRLAALLDQGHPTLNQEEAEPVLRLYGSLSREQREALRAGKRIPYQALSGTQRAVWDQMVYGVRPLTERPSFGFRQPRLARDRLDGLAIEPTFEWPNGIPAGASLGLEIKHDFELKPQPKNNVFFGGAYDLASDLFYLQNPDCIEGDISSWRRADTFIVYEKSTYRFDLVLDENFAWRGLYNDMRDTTGPVTFDQFPKNIRDSILARVEEMNRQKAAGVKFKLTLGMRPGVKPPPPPR